MAQELGLDLVEVSPAARPPVCKIMDFGKHKYELAKKLRKNRAASKQYELKQIRLGRSVKIDPHDVEIRVNQARKFLTAGHKVQFTQRFRGREVVHKDIGLKRLNEIAQELSDVSNLEQTAKWAGRQATIVLAPLASSREDAKQTKPHTSDR
jgi:translation initiation factor IF-3